MIRCDNLLSRPSLLLYPMLDTAGSVISRIPCIRFGPLRLALLIRCDSNPSRSSVR